MMAGTSNVPKLLEFIASTHFGQYLIRKVDSLLWTFESPAKYGVHGKRVNESRTLPWPIFWTLYFYMQIFRMVFSMILLPLNKNPIEMKDIVTTIQTWRRALRSIRFRGLRSIREANDSKTKENGTDVTSSPPRKMPNKKRNYDEMLDYDLLEEVINRTFSDGDLTDPTYMPLDGDEVSSDGSSMQGNGVTNGEGAPNAAESSLQDTMPVSANESAQPEPNHLSKSNESTFVSTVDDTEESAFVMTEEDSSMASSGDIGKKPESNAKLTTDTQSGKAGKIGKESLNQPLDPVDAMMAGLMARDTKMNFKKNGKNHYGNKKKRNFSAGGDFENGDRQSESKENRSHEDLNRL